MSNIINVKETRNVLSFSGEVFNIVAGSTNFYLQFEFDDEWLKSPIFIVIFDFDGTKEYVELDEEYKCQIPPTNSEKILFSVTAEPSEHEKFSSTILSLVVEESVDSSLENIEPYKGTHETFLGLIGNLKNGIGVVAEKSKYSETQVSLTGDDTISGEKDFVGTLKSKSEIVPNVQQISNQNFILNGNFVINQRGKSTYTRNGEDMFTVDRWGLFYSDGKFKVSTKTLTGLSDTATMLCQWIDKADSMLYGRTITVSALINGERRFKTITLPSTYSEDYIENIYEGEGYSFRIYVIRLYKRFGVQFFVEKDISITLDEVKVEASDVLTKYLPRLYGEELALCQRFYQKAYVYAIGFGQTTEKVMFFISLPDTMSGQRSFKMGSTPKIIKDGEIFTPDSFELHQVQTNGVVMIAYGTDVAVDSLYFLVQGIIYLDGELYL